MRGPIISDHTVLYLSFSPFVRKNVKMDEKVLERVQDHFDRFVKGRGVEQYQSTIANAVYAISAEDEYVVVPYNTCFGRLSGLKSTWHLIEGLPDAVFIQIQTTGVAVEKTRMFYEWLTNFSPYRDAFITKDASEILKKKALILDTGVRAELMVGGAITARSPWEAFSGIRYTQDSLLLWNEMVEAGINPDFAFISAFGMRKSGKNLTVGTSQGHSALQYGVGAVGALNIHQNFMNRVTKGKGSTYRSKCGYETPSQLWQVPVKKGIGDFSTWLRDTVEEIANGKKSEKINPFANVSTTSVVTKDKFIAGLVEREGDFLERIAA